MKKAFGLIFLINFVIAGFINPVLADDNARSLFNDSLNKTAQETGHAENDFANKEITEVIGQVINILLSVLGIAFLLLMIYGGFIWMNSRGSEQEVARATNIIRNALIGLIIVIGAYAITAFVGSFFSIKN